MEDFRLKGAIIGRFGSQIRGARHMKIEETRLNRIINGWIKPRPEELVKLRAVLGHVVDEVLQQREKLSA